MNDLGIMLISTLYMDKCLMIRSIKLYAKQKID